MGSRPVRALWIEIQERLATTIVDTVEAREGLVD